MKRNNRIRSTVAVCVQVQLRLATSPLRKMYLPLGQCDPPTMRNSILTTTAVLVLLGASAGQPAYSSEARCEGALSGQHGSIRVPDGASCSLNGVRTNGSVQVGRGGSLAMTGSRIGGNVQADGARSVTIDGGSIDGNVQLNGGTSVRIVNAAVEGNMQLQGHRATVVATSNRVGGNLQVSGNRGGATLRNNVMSGNLQCSGNAPAPAGGGNRAAAKQEQCGDL